MHLVGDVHRDLVVQSRRRAKRRSTVVGPECSDVDLVRGADCRCPAIAAEKLRFIVSICVLGAAECRRRRNPELLSSLQNEGPNRTPKRAQRDWTLADG